ncbi:MAG: OsmC family protein [Bacteroidales bacterium]
MSKTHHYACNLEWTGNRGLGTAGYRTYDRDARCPLPCKADIPLSSDPAFRGDPTRANPEELLVASLSSCHMLWYLHLCAEAGVVVTAYRDAATGTMEEMDGGSGRFTEVILRPAVMVMHSSMVKKAEELHEMAHRMCFIANSVNFLVKAEPEVRSEPGMEDRVG